mmetsp:Transcript_55385/g.160517  ORF Transcript_55385/g.160517 Transcript_55385/m.160517 type:complete len:207 (-) Transcript_55385:76-696(-)
MRLLPPYPGDSLLDHWHAPGPRGPRGAGGGDARHLHRLPLRRRHCLRHSRDRPLALSACPLGRGLAEHPRHGLCLVVPVSRSVVRLGLRESRRYRRRERCARPGSRPRAPGDHRFHSSSLIDLPARSGRGLRVRGMGPRGGEKRAEDGADHRQCIVNPHRLHVGALLRRRPGGDREHDGASVHDEDGPHLLGHVLRRPGVAPPHPR